MRFSFIKPKSELRPYIASLWIFESQYGLPVLDRSIAAPNGCPKLIILYENSLTSVVESRTRASCEGMYFVGTRDRSALIRCSSRKTGIIGIEFFPHGASPLFGIPMQEAVNQLFQIEAIFGHWGRETWEALRNLYDVPSKVDFVQDQLIRLLHKNQRDNRLISFCVSALERTAGRMAINQLELKTGYSRRYLDLLFKQHVGFSPKVIAEIFRFQWFYRKWALGLPYDAMKRDVYGYYYDQAHFIKEFKKMTGYAPREFSLKVSNEFGRRMSLKQDFPFLQ